MVRDTFHLDKALDYDYIPLSGNLLRSAGSLGSYYTAKVYHTPYGYVLLLHDMTGSRASLPDRVIVSKNEFSSLEDFMNKATNFGYNDEVTPITLDEYFQFVQE